MGKKERGESVVAGRRCQPSEDTSSQPQPQARSAGAAGVPRLKFHSQVAHRADLVTTGMCRLCPPAASRSLIPGWLPRDAQAPAAGMEAAGEGRAALCVL